MCTVPLAVPICCVDGACDNSKLLSRCLRSQTSSAPRDMSAGKAIVRVVAMSRAAFVLCGVAPQLQAKRYKTR